MAIFNSYVKLPEGIVLTPFFTLDLDSFYHSHSASEQQTVPSQNASQNSPSQRLSAAQSLHAPWFCLRGCNKKHNVGKTMP